MMLPEGQYENASYVDSGKTNIGARLNARPRINHSWGVQLSGDTANGPLSYHDLNLSYGIKAYTSGSTVFMKVTGSPCNRGVKCGASVGIEYKLDDVASSVFGDMWVPHEQTKTMREIFDSCSLYQSFGCDTEQAVTDFNGFNSIIKYVECGLKSAGTMIGLRFTMARGVPMFSFTISKSALGSF